MNLHDLPRENTYPPLLEEYKPGISTYLTYIATMGTRHREGIRVLVNRAGIVFVRNSIDSQVPMIDEFRPNSLLDWPRTMPQYNTRPFDWSMVELVDDVGITRTGY